MTRFEHKTSFHFLTMDSAEPAKARNGIWVMPFMYRRYSGKCEIFIKSSFISF